MSNSKFIALFLAGSVLAALALALLEWHGRTAQTPLVRRSLSALAPDGAKTVAFGDVRLSCENGVWFMVSPVRAQCSQPVVRRMLDALQQAYPADTRTDEDLARGFAGLPDIE